MKRSYGLLAGLTLVAMVYAQMASAATVYYVSLTGTGNGSSWATATNSIQGAIDVIADTPISTVWVSNGLYDTGGLTNWPPIAGNVLANRVVINKGITVRSLNGPAVTTIKGAWDMTVGGGGYFTNGPLAARCVYMTNDAWLIGFTLTNGACLYGGGQNYESGGGVWCNSTNSYITNCVIAGNRSFKAGAGVRRGTLYDCRIVGNAIPAAGGDGVGFGYSVLFNCIVSGNSNLGGGSFAGAGGMGGLVYRSMISSNRSWGAGGFGGGVANVRLTDSTVAYNTSYHGGGGFDCSMTRCLVYRNRAQVDRGGAGSYSNFGGWAGLGGYNNCVIAQNTAGRDGGGLEWVQAVNCRIVSNITYGGWGGAGAGAHSCSLTNCLVAWNSALDYSGGTDSGGGTWNGTNYNCTIVSNFSADVGGGVYGSVMYNSISWDNNTNDAGGYVAFYSCGVGYPLVNGNITDNPLFEGSGADPYRLSRDSPCLNKGTNQAWMANALDLAGEMRIRYGRVDMGAYEAPPPPATILVVQ